MILASENIAVMLGFPKTWWSSAVAEWKLVYNNLQVLFGEDPSISKPIQQNEKSTQIYVKINTDIASMYEHQDTIFQSHWLGQLAFGTDMHAL